MKRSKRLAVVLDLAEQSEQAAAELLETARGLLMDDQHKLEEVENYIREYEKDFMTPGADVRVEEIIRQRGFLSQLAEIKKQQIEVVKHRKEIVTVHRTAWHQAHVKKKALKDLIQRCQKHEMASLNRAEEKMLDDWYLQSFNRKKAEKCADSSGSDV